MRNAIYFLIGFLWMPSAYLWATSWPHGAETWGWYFCVTIPASMIVGGGIGLAFAVLKTHLENRREDKFWRALDEESRVRAARMEGATDDEESEGKN